MPDFYIKRGPFPAVWPELPKFRHFGTILNVLGKSQRVYLVFGKMFILLWQKCHGIGQVFIVVNSYKHKNNLAIWACWFPASFWLFHSCPFYTIKIVDVTGIQTRIVGINVAHLTTRPPSRPRGSGYYVTSNWESKQFCSGEFRQCLRAPWSAATSVTR